jgi:hypothetical protein
MTCVWNAILSRMSGEEIQLLERKTPNALAKWVKSLKMKTPDIQVNGNSLKQKEMEENIERLKNINNIRNGYDMSSSDPLLIVLSQRLGWEIRFKFVNTNIIIKNTGRKNPKIVNFRSSRTHFY